MADFQMFMCLIGGTHTTPLNVMAYKSDDKIINALCLWFYLMALANITHY